MENKTDLRTKIKSLRKQIDVEGKSALICAKIKELPCFLTAQNIMIFYPTKFEVNLLELRDSGKHFYFPKVNEDKMLVCPDIGKFEKSSFNINEPCSNPVDPNVLDLIIVPALAVDKMNYRLGYGGGFYDRFLSANPDIPTLTPVFKEFIYDKLPIEEFDIPVDYVVSD